MPATPPSSSSSSGQRRSRSASPPTPGPPTPPESQLLATSEDEQQSSPPPSGPVSKIDDSQPSTGSTADQPGLRSPQDQINASSRPLDDDRPCNEAGKDDSVTTSRPSGSTSPELQTQPQSQSPHSSPSSPLQTRSPRQNGLERSSSEESIGNDALTEGGGSSIDSNEERTSTATTSATGAVTTEAGHSDADGEVFSDEWLADMRRVKVSINVLFVISPLVVRLFDNRCILRRRWMTHRCNRIPNFGQPKRPIYESGGLVMFFIPLHHPSTRSCHGRRS